MTNSSAFDSELPTVMSPLAAVAWKNDSDDAVRGRLVSTSFRDADAFFHHHS